MKRILLGMIFILGSLWAVKPVAKIEKTNEDKKPVIQIPIPDESKEDPKVENDDTPEINKPKSQNNKNDQFIDIDSNNVNDQRENDLLKIKQLKTKFKDLLKKDDDKNRTSKQPVKTKKSIKK